MREYGVSAANSDLSEAWFPLRHHEQQAEAYFSSKRFLALACGRGSGKTELARRRIIRYLPVKKDWSDPIYFYALPTYGQARRVAWGALLRLIPQSWIRRVRESSLVVETIFGSMLYVVGLDKPQRVEGVQWDGCVIDESCDQKPGVFDRSISPALTHREGWCWRIGVPKRHGVGAGEFRDFCELGASGADPDIVTYSWPSEDILTKAQVESFQRILDPRDYAEQFQATWQDMGGSIFYAYDPKVNLTDYQYDPESLLIIGSDFNVNPMCWTVGQVKEGKLFLFDELFLRNTNTQETLDALYERYPNHKAGWLFLGDATARARKTSAVITDYVQIRNDARFINAKVRYLRKNPPIADRFAACNALLRNASGESRCFVHPKCEHLITDLKGRTYKESSREPDDYGDVGHMSDAWGYIVYMLFPITLQVDMASAIVTV